MVELYRHFRPTGVHAVNEFLLVWYGFIALDIYHAPAGGPVVVKLRAANYYKAETAFRPPVIKLLEAFARHSIIRKQCMNCRHHNSVFYFKVSYSDFLEQSFVFHGIPLWKKSLIQFKNRHAGHSADSLLSKNNTSLLPSGNTSAKSLPEWLVLNVNHEEYHSVVSCGIFPRPHVSGCPGQHPGPGFHAGKVSRESRLTHL
jgi:hypothetical protein